MQILSTDISLFHDQYKLIRLQIIRIYKKKKKNLKQPIHLDQFSSPPIPPLPEFLWLEGASAPHIR